MRYGTTGGKENENMMNMPIGKQRYFNNYAGSQHSESLNHPAIHHSYASDKVSAYSNYTGMTNDYQAVNSSQISKMPGVYMID